MKTQAFTCGTEEQTKALAEKIADSSQPGDIFCFNGTLGAGKTAFCRYFIQHMIGQNTEVPSPTFTLVQTYQTDRIEIWHFDLYRLKEPEELYEIGWEEALNNNIILVEWPEKAGVLLPDDAKTINITINEDKSRTFLIKNMEELKHG
ncbi:MAG: tRNA (adenosine(37)-N6)-threonylcarbamoyltransferase complex ATPase subunit type 1 TsaE [Pseudomonadota bacterium]